MKVLFVCSGNAHRSPLAEALLKKLRPDLEVDSAGTHIAIPISEEVREYLTKRKAKQYLKRVPEGLYAKQLSEYDLIVAMEQRHKDYVLSRCPECEHKTALWNIEDPYFQPRGHTRKIFNQIREKVSRLASSL